MLLLGGNYTMNQCSDLSFAMRLLKKLLLPNCIIPLSQLSHSTQIDLKLRYLLFGENHSSLGAMIPPNSLKEKTIYRMTDEYYCNYIFFQIPKNHGKDGENSCFFIGPYMKEDISENKLLELVAKGLLSNQQLSQLKDYYLSLPLFTDEGIIYSIINTLGESLWENNSNICLEYVDYKAPDISISLLQTPEQYLEEDPLLSIEAIEKRYEKENNFMHSISQGNLTKIFFIFSNSFQQGMEQRVADPIRNIKNYMIILNTILRKAVEQGSVHPLYIDRLSSTYARKIETIQSISDGTSMQKEMIHKYCLLIKNYSLKQYSPIIQRVLTYINFDMTADLTLKKIANTFNMNASYLSNLFRKETGQTLTDYVTQKRVSHAVYLLNHTNMQIQMVAQACGIHDVNYFVKVFKKYVNMTPSQYRSYISNPNV